MKTSFREFFAAILKCLDAIGFIARNRMAHFFLYPIVLSILLSMGAVVFIKYVVGVVMTHISPLFQYTPLNGSIWQNTKAVLSDAGLYATAFLLFLFGWCLFNKIRKYMVLALVSPILALVSERTENVLTGQQRTFNRKKIIQDSLRGIAISLRNFCMELLLTTLLWCALIYLSLLLPFLSFLLVPVLAILTYLIGAYFFGFSAIDYYSERKDMSIQESIKYVRKHRSTAMGNGFVFSLLFMLPFIGVTFGTIICTVAATISCFELDQSANQNQEVNEKNIRLK